MTRIARTYAALKRGIAALRRGPAIFRQEAEAGEARRSARAMGPPPPPPAPPPRRSAAVRFADRQARAMPWILAVVLIGGLLVNGDGRILEVAQEGEGWIARFRVPGDPDGAWRPVSALRAQAWLALRWTVISLVSAGVTLTLLGYAVRAVRKARARKRP
ncbi:hypothetical protein ACQ5SO_01125 [Rhodovulum sp. DZ06]|uniref:hypothetical protein n=1 Tax=Rhodovulum sp. DZ06 TaxID=3425126 RepID=UPI003D3514A6